MAEYIKPTEGAWLRKIDNANGSTRLTAGVPLNIVKGTPITMTLQGSRGQGQDIAEGLPASVMFGTDLGLAKYALGTDNQHSIIHNVSGKLPGGINANLGYSANSDYAGHNLNLSKRSHDGNLGVGMHYSAGEDKYRGPSSRHGLFVDGTLLNRVNRDNDALREGLAYTAALNSNNEGGYTPEARLEYRRTF